MDTTQAHRKIELQSPADLSYLISNVRRAAAAHINDAFPPVPLSTTANTTTTSSLPEGDELRTQIESLVEEYIARTFTFAAPNLTINGLPVPDATPYLSGFSDSNQNDGVEDQHEPFDGRKRDRIFALAKEEEYLLAEIAALKKKVPSKTARGWAQRVKDGIEADEGVLARKREEIERVVGEEEDRKGREKLVDGLERQGDVERAFGGAVATLSRLKGDMPATVAKMERARVAGEYVVTER